VLGRVLLCSVRGPGLAVGASIGLELCSCSQFRRQQPTPGAHGWAPLLWLPWVGPSHCCCWLLLLPLLLLLPPLQVNCQDANGHTALHIAALLNHHHLIGPLLAAGVDASLRDKSKHTAQELALDKGSDDVLRQLEALKL
jgi:ankyrin repeat protein